MTSKRRSGAMRVKLPPNSNPPPVTREKDENSASATLQIAVVTLLPTRSRRAAPEGSTQQGKAERHPRPSAAPRRFGKRQRTGRSSLPKELAHRLDVGVDERGGRLLDLPSDGAGILSENRGGHPAGESPRPASGPPPACRCRRHGSGSR